MCFDAEFYDREFPQYKPLTIISLEIRPQQRKLHKMLYLIVLRKLEGKELTNSFKQNARHSDFQHFEV